MRSSNQQRGNEFGNREEILQQQTLHQDFWTESIHNEATTLTRLTKLIFMEGCILHDADLACYFMLVTIYVYVSLYRKKLLGELCATTTTRVRLIKHSEAADT